MCATSSSAFDGSATAELRRRATTELRPGATWSSSAVMPSFASTFITYFAAACSFPGGFVVLILIRSWNHVRASAVIEVRSPTGDWLAGRLLVGGGATCALSGRANGDIAAAAAKKHAAASSGICLQRFQITRQSSVGVSGLT